MSDEPWCVVIVRAWGDAGGVRIRLLRCSNEGYESAVELSAEAAGRRLTTWLVRLVDNNGSAR